MPCGWTWLVGFSQSSTVVSKAGGISAQNASGVRVLRSLMAFKKKKKWNVDGFAPLYTIFTSRIACWYKCQTQGRKIGHSNPDRSSRRIFFSRVNFVCWLSFSVCFTPVLPQWHIEDPGHSAIVQVAGYTYTGIHSWPNEVRVGWLCCCPGIVWEPVRKWAHVQLIRVHSGRVISARWATVGWSWPKEWNWCAQANLRFKKKKDKSPW